MESTAITGNSHLELILNQLDALPTLPVIAVRLLSLTSSNESESQDVIDLIRSDPALTVKVLAMCRKAKKNGLRDDATSMERAVVLLGFNAIRNAALSVKVFETFSRSQEADKGGDDSDPQFDCVNFWRHCLAVAIVSELIAESHPDQRDLPASEAFVCGLLHDIGKLALHLMLPKSYARVIELADLNQGNIAQFEQRIIGIDHHTVGKRLAERWQLPHRLQDCIWLHGTAPAMLPDLPHRRLVGLVGLADLMVRRQHVGYSGNFVLTDQPTQVAQALGFDPQVINSVTLKMHERLQQRSAEMGLDDQATPSLYLDSMQRANEALVKLSNARDRRSRGSQRQAQVLESIAALQENAAPGHNTHEVLDLVAASAAAVLGPGYYTLICQPRSSDSAPWLIAQYDPDGQPQSKQTIEPPDDALPISEFDAAPGASLGQAGVLTSVIAHLTEAPDLRRVRMMPLVCGRGTAAVLLHDRAELPSALLLRAAASTWGAMIVATVQHDSDRRLGEQLIEANRSLVDAQEQLVHNQSMARLGEMAAGATHAMNNPLAVICGRGQSLHANLEPGTAEQKTAQDIVEQAQKLNDLITSLRMFTHPPTAEKRLTDVECLVHETVERARRDLGEAARSTPCACKVQSDMPAVMIDPEQVAMALTELLNNAFEAQPKGNIELSVRFDRHKHQLVITVSDDGRGMDEHMLSHAFDPFFSAKKKGRHGGMGLPRAQQWVDGHGGKLALRSTPDSGTVATVLLPVDSAA